MYSKQMVDVFKRTYCDENRVAAEILRQQARSLADETILDAGCGMGDIAAVAFADSKVTLLDRLDFSSYPTPKNHKRVTIDFFDYVPQ
ncbi:MAG: hypothetical protein LAO30_22205, partial [Acidobacteriia bacterium]|nr:hypothetical protein [Terriglobia bacterium]